MTKQSQPSPRRCELCDMVSNGNTWRVGLDQTVLVGWAGLGREWDLGVGREAGTRLVCRWGGSVKKAAVGVEAWAEALGWLVSICACEHIKDRSTSNLNLYLLRSPKPTELHCKNDVLHQIVFGTVKVSATVHDFSQTRVLKQLSILWVLTSPDIIVRNVKTFALVSDNRLVLLPLRSCGSEHNGFRISSLRSFVYQLKSFLSL